MITSKTRKMTQIAGVTLLAMGAFACDRGEPVDSSTTRQAVTTNTRALSEQVATSLTILEKSQMYQDAFSYESCSGTYDPQTDEYVEDCYTEEPPSLDEDLDEGTDFLVEFLNEYVFTDDNVEDSSRREITYLLRGSTVCQDLRDEEPDSYDECVDVVDGLELRLVVTSPQEGDITVDVLVSDKRYNPLRVDLWQDELAFEVGLKSARDSAVFLADKLDGEDITSELPDTIEGRFRAAMRIEGPQQLRASLSVLETIRVADPQERYDVTIATSPYAMRMFADASTDTMTYSVDWNAIDAKFPFHEYVYHEDVRSPGEEGWGEGTEERVEHLADVHASGLSGEVVFQAAQDVLKFKNLGLGAETSTLDLDGERVLEVDLNADSGRTFDMDLTYEGDEVEVGFSPEMDLKVMLAFGRVAQEFEQGLFEDWALEDVIRVHLADDPVLRYPYDADRIEIARGSATISSASLDVTVSADTGQCLVDSYQPEEPSPLETCGGESCVGGSEDPEPYHPVRALEATMCGQ